MLTPEVLGKPRTEHAQQTAIFCWIANTGVHQDEDLKWVHAIANGGERDVIVAGRLKAEGIRAGVWDICVPVPRYGYHGLYIEMKKPGREKEKYGGLSDPQRDFGLFVHRKGYLTKVCYTWQQGVAVLKEYFNVS